MTDVTLAKRLPPQTLEPWRESEWQRLWLAVRARPWNALAIVPAGPCSSPEFTLRVAVTLSRTGMLHLGSPIQVADATQLPLAHLSTFIEEIRRCAANGDLVILAVTALRDNPVALALTQSADAAVLCVLLEKMNLADGHKTVLEVGASRFIGSAIFHPTGTIASVPR